MKYEQMLEEGLERIFEAVLGDNGTDRISDFKRHTTNPDEGLGGNSIDDLETECLRLKDVH